MDLNSSNYFRNLFWFFWSMVLDAIADIAIGHFWLRWNFLCCG